MRRKGLSVEAANQQIVRSDGHIPEGHFALSFCLRRQQDFCLRRQKNECRIRYTTVDLSVLKIHPQPPYNIIQYNTAQYRIQRDIRVDFPV